MRAQPGEVWEWWSDEAGKPKYHLCLSLEGCFLFLNSPKLRSYPGDFVISNSDVPFLPPTADGRSIISCSLLLRMLPTELSAKGAQCVGSVTTELLRNLLLFLEKTPVMPEDDRSDAVDGLYDWGLP